MKKFSQQQYTQLSLDFEFCVTEPVKECPVKAEYHRFSKAEIEEAMAIEDDLMFGRGAWLYKQLERELAQERKAAKALKEFEAIRASIYSNNNF